MAVIKDELEEAIKEENAALLQFAAATKKGTRADLEITAARARLRNARSTKSALYHDMMSNNPRVKSLMPTNV